MLFSGARHSQLNAEMSERISEGWAHLKIPERKKMKSGFVKMISHVVDMQPSYSDFYKLFEKSLPNLIAIKNINIH